MACVSRCTNRVIVDRRLLADYFATYRWVAGNLFRHRQCFPWQQSARRRQQHAVVSAAFQRLITDFLVIQIPTKRRSKEIAAAGQSLLCDS